MSSVSAELLQSLDGIAAETNLMIELLDEARGTIDDAEQARSEAPDLRDQRKARN